VGGVGTGMPSGLANTPSTVHKIILYINFWKGWEGFYDHIHIYTTRKILKLMIIYRTILITELKCSVRTLL
jgi:hypothetical protein